MFPFYQKALMSLTLAMLAAESPSGPYAPSLGEAAIVNQQSTNAAGNIECAASLLPRLGTSSFGNEALACGTPPTKPTGCDEQICICDSDGNNCNWACIAK